MRIRIAAALLVTGFLLSGCSGSNGNLGDTDPTSGNGAPPAPPAGVGDFVPLFRPTSGLLPFPIDLYFNGSTDGTLNIPATTLFPLRVTMNQQDGFSTTASSNFRMSMAVNDDAVMLNSNVRIIRAPMLRQSNGVYAPVGALGVLQPGVDYSVRIAPEGDTLGSTVEIEWLRPLAASTGQGLGNGYIVLVTNGIRNTSNSTPTPDSDYLIVKSEAIAELGRAIASGNPATYVPTCPGITDATLNGICRLTYAHFAIGSNPALGPAAINPANVILSYSFTVQSTRDALVEMSQTRTPQPMTAVPTGLTSGALLAAGGLPNNPLCPNCADVFAGTIQVPYFLSPPSVADPTAPLTKAWVAAGPSPVPGIAATSRDITRFNLVPELKATLRLPTLIFKPNGNSPSGGVKPASGYPVVVVMHGITRNRTDAVAVADTYASQGFVVVAIDQPLHGLTSVANPLYAGAANPLAATLYGAEVRERTFDVDYIDNSTGAAGPDGFIDPSGTHAINLSAPLVTRDGVRQQGSDLITLVKSLAAGNLDLDGAAGGDIDVTRIHFAGLSLGAITGMACVCSEVRSFYMNVPGGTLPDILRTSPSFMNRINAGLAQVNPLLQPGSSLYSEFFRELEAAWDAGDPSNYVRQLVQDRPVLLAKVIGDNVVPNGTNDFLIRAAGAVKESTAGLKPIAAGSPKFVTFTAGNHSSFFSPAASLEVTQEMQTHALTLAASDGNAFQIVNSGILEP